MGDALKLLNPNILRVVFKPCLDIRACFRAIRRKYQVPENVTQGLIVIGALGTGAAAPFLIPVYGTWVGGILTSTFGHGLPTVIHSSLVSVTSSWIVGYPTSTITRWCIRGMRKLIWGDWDFRMTAEECVRLAEKLHINTPTLQRIFAETVKNYRDPPGYLCFRKEDYLHIIQCILAGDRTGIFMYYKQQEMLDQVARDLEEAENTQRRIKAQRRNAVLLHGNEFDAEELASIIASEEPDLEVGTEGGSSLEDSKAATTEIAPLRFSASPPSATHEKLSFRTAASVVFASVRMQHARTKSSLRFAARIPAASDDPRITEKLHQLREHINQTRDREFFAEEQERKQLIHQAMEIHRTTLEGSPAEISRKSDAFLRLIQAKSIEEIQGYIRSDEELLKLRAERRSHPHPPPM